MRKQNLAMGAAVVVAGLFATRRSRQQGKPARLLDTRDPEPGQPDPRDLLTDPIAKAPVSAGVKVLDAVFRRVFGSGAVALTAYPAMPHGYINRPYLCRDSGLAMGEIVAEQRRYLRD